MAQYTYPQLVGFARNAGFTGNNAYTAAAVAMAESSGNSNAIAYNDGGKGYNSYGLMQINGVNDAAVGGASNALDPQTSFNQAYILSGGSNFSPWSTYKSGAYQQYLDPSVTPAAMSGGGGITITAPSSFDTGSGFGSDGLTPYATPDTTTVGQTVTQPGGALAGLPIGTGGNVNVGLQPSTVQDIGSWIQAPITAFENYASSWFGSLTNWFSRGFLIILAIMIVFVALWRLSGGNTQQIVTAARMAA